MSKVARRWSWVRRCAGNWNPIKAVGHPNPPSWILYKPGTHDPQTAEGFIALSGKLPRISTIRRTLSGLSKVTEGFSSILVLSLLYLLQRNECAVMFISRPKRSPEATEVVAWLFVAVEDIYIMPWQGVSGTFPWIQTNLLILNVKFGRVKEQHKNVDKTKKGRIKGLTRRRDEDGETNEGNGVGENSKRQELWVQIYQNFSGLVQFSISTGQLFYSPPKR